MTMPTNGEIFEYWKDWLNDNGFDWGEPSCWACRRWWGTKYDTQNPKTSWDEIKKLWNKVTPLQRCHIIPRSLGGTDNPSNLFLMCRDCHDKAPDTSSREKFLLWAKAQSWVKREIIEIKENIEVFGIKENELNEFVNILNSPDFKKWAKNNTGLHWNQQGHGIKLKKSTLIGAVIEYKNKILANK